MLVRPGFEPGPTAWQFLCSPNWVYHAVVNQSRLNSIEELRSQFPDVTGMYWGIMLVPRGRHKMEQKTDKTILIINAILLILFEPAIVVSRYMTCTLFKTIKIGFWKKNPSFEKNLSLKKPEFWKILSVKKYYNVKRKNLGFFQGNNKFYHFPK